MIGLNNFQKERDAWRDPSLLTEIPYGVRRSLAIAITKLGEALAARSDSPSEFIRHWEQAEYWLESAFEELPAQPENPKYEEFNK